MQLSTTALSSLCVGAFLAALTLTALARRYALWRQLVDAPGERRSHQVATPRGGGIAIVVVIVPAMLWLARVEPETAPVYLLGAWGLALVAGIGWIDDHRGLSPWGRLLVHVLAAALLAAGMMWSGQPPWRALVVFALALGLVNVWNFMDGINGIAASQAVLVALGIALLATSGAALVLCCVLAAACLGFLPLNFPNARIFLGDVGSGALGYATACLVALAATLPPVGLLLVALPLSAFLIDATLTLLSRIIRGERWWTPHVQHMYQRWVQAGHSHAVVTLAYAAWTLLSILVAIRLARAPQPVIIGAFATWYVLGVAIWLMFRARPPGAVRLS